MRTAVELLLWWGLLLLLSMVLISSVSVLEVAVGGGIAAIGALGAVAARRASGAALGGAAGWARALWAFPVTLLADTGRLAVLVLRTLRGPRRPPEGGGFRTVRLAPGTGAAWAGALLSATPGGYVVEARDGVLTVHTLDGSVPALQRALTGGPR
ncbi:hypothetical protein ABTX81_23015 [Kitasatospora sp. NPDC097605]|uniref:hypothetical protein n=1 Tax=Kitasatospora sp. NPDC097605 TaxID=3157226 RepID=UPI00331F47CC